MSFSLRLVSIFSYATAMVQHKEATLTLALNGRVFENRKLTIKEVGEFTSSL